MAGSKTSDKTPDKPESLVHTEERQAKIAAEYEQYVAAEQEREKHFQEDQEIVAFKGLPKEGETREQLLDRIRKIRAEEAQVEQKEPPRPIIIESVRKQIEAEQAAGRAAVAKAEAEAEMYKELREKAIAEDAARKGSTSTVHQPNPGMGEKFPVNKATIK